MGSLGIEVDLGWGLDLEYRIFRVEGCGYC
jgi:hypothetical protein